jgi:hypothetical protein
MQKLFDINRYQKERNTLVDGSDALANKKELVISFYHVPSRRSVFFKAFITAFTETYNSNFTSNEVFGRTDPIYQFKNTTRKISLTFTVPAASEGEAYENLGKVSLLEQMLYPSYQDLDSSDVESATTLNQSPLIRLKVMNLLQTPSVPAPPPPIPGSDGSVISQSRESMFIEYESTSDSMRGLLGIIDNLSVNHNIGGEDSVFHKTRTLPDENGRLKTAGVPNTILPKNIELSLGFSPQHEFTVGWQEDGMSNFNLFPYGVLTEDTAYGAEKNPDPITAYKKEVERNKAEEQKRQQRQQLEDNAKARYAKANGQLRMGRVKRDIKRGKFSDERSYLVGLGAEGGLTTNDEGDIFIKDMLQ